MAEGKGAYTAEIAGQAVPANGGAGAFANPEGVDLLIVDAWMQVDTASADAATINVGVGAAADDNSNLVSAVAINGAIGGKVYRSAAGLVAAEAEAILWAADKYLNATVSAASAAFKGTLYVKYIRL